MTDPSRDEKSWIALISAVALFSFILGAAITSLSIRHENIHSAGAWIGQLIYDFQSLIVGFGAIVAAVLSVAKINDQIEAQRKQHIADKRFVLRKETAALHDCMVLAQDAEQLTFENAKFFGEIVNNGEPILTLEPMLILERHRDALPGDIVEQIKRLHWNIEAHNNYKDKPISYTTQEGLVMAARVVGMSLKTKVIKQVAELKSYLE